MGTKADGGGEGYLPTWLERHRVALTKLVKREKAVSLKLYWFSRDKRDEDDVVETLDVTPGSLGLDDLADWVGRMWRERGGPLRLRAFGPYGANGNTVEVCDVYITSGPDGGGSSQVAKRGRFMDLDDDEAGEAREGLKELAEWGRPFIRVLAQEVVRAQGGTPVDDDEEDKDE